MVSTPQLVQALQALWNRARPTLASLDQDRAHMLAVESAAWEVSATEWKVYRLAWHDRTKRVEHERRRPGMALLGMACDRVVEQVRSVEVRSGMLAWHSYNMGFVIKTPRACIGIDLLCAGSLELADVLDALVITHPHDDHLDRELVNAMVARGRSVISMFEERGTVVRSPCRIPIAPGVEGRFGIGDHLYFKPDQCNDMLLCLLDAGADGSFYHTGDNSNAGKVMGDFVPDAMTFHVQVCLDTSAALQRVAPRLAIGAHVLELGHPPDQWRWRYQTAIDELSCVPPDQASVPIWGTCYRIRG